MSAGEKILIFMGSKWFALFWAIILLVALPFTFNNAKVVWNGQAALNSAGMGTLYWLLTAVFVCNVLGFLFASVKFLSMNSSKEVDSSRLESNW